MKATGKNPHSLWNMVPETDEEMAWLEGQRHGLICHDPRCSFCQEQHDKALAARKNG